MENVILKAREIYSRIADEESKFLFKNYLLYNITGEKKYIKNILVKSWGLCLNNIEKIPHGAKTIVYGAGNNCDMALCICETLGIDVACICDRNKEKQVTGWYRGGYTIISPDELVENHRDAFIIISSTIYKEEIEEWLLNYFNREVIVSLAKNNDIIIGKEQYFDKEILHLCENEVFIDGGAYDFDTSKLLLKKCKPEKIFAFEPDRDNLNKIQTSIGTYSDVEIELINKGLWNQADTLYFNSSGDKESCIVEEGNDMIEVAAIDDLIQEKVTFIKMDIEGAEMNALIGAQKLISKYKPKLAICVYHKVNDLIDIPSFVLSLVPEYKLYLRHYSWTPAEMVMYAVV